MFADDGVAYREHVDPLVGPAAFQVFEAKFYADNPKVNTTWTTDAVRVSEAGDIAIQTGEFHSAGLGPNGDREDRGRYVTVWKKMNGEWKVGARHRLDHNAGGCYGKEAVTLDRDRRTHPMKTEHIGAC
jgi:ketosteroid isomerase-like protein